ncbi:MAG: protein-L-isoaspartate(D-aspartate) O-methyltransferase [Planctomycetes bacterium]|nr:protein-L-isoaspartate(D-aspartate) O-methyltransferase [Planctomycetota bacterium]
MDPFAIEKKQMITEHLLHRGINDSRILAAFQKIPRHLFVREEYEDSAYTDNPLPIGHGQTISQPYIVAYSLQALALRGDEKILEIGTGSGYQTALLAELTRQVYTVERIPELSDAAKARLDSLGYANITFKTGDGTLGLMESAPFDGIIVSAGAPFVPDSYKNQLTIGGKIVIPVGNEFSQDLLRITRTDENKFSTESLCPCVFVKLIGEQGWRNGTL